MKFKWVMLSFLLVTALAAIGCAPTKAPETAVPAEYRSLRMVAGSLGGSGTSAVMSYAVTLNKYYPEIQWSSASGAMTTNAIYLDKGILKLAVTGATSFIDTWGFDKVPESRLKSVSLPFAPNQAFWLIREDRPWTDLTQVPKGTAISPGTPGGSGIILAEAWLNLLGLSKKDFNWIPLGKAEQADAWRSGKVEVVLAQVTGMAPGLMDMWTSPYKFKPMGLSQEQADRAIAEKTFERIGSERPRRSNLTELVPELFKNEVIAVQQAFLLSARDDFPDEIAYKMAKIIDEHKAELAAIYAPMKYASPQHHIEWASQPLAIHSGVAKYYKEKGYLK